MVVAMEEEGAAMVVVDLVDMEVEADIVEVVVDMEVEAGIMAVGDMEVGEGVDTERYRISITMGDMDMVDMVDMDTPTMVIMIMDRTIMTTYHYLFRILLIFIRLPH